MKLLATQPQLMVILPARSRKRNTINVTITESRQRDSGTLSSPSALHPRNEESYHRILTMEKVKLSEVPEYLRDGELYKSMMENSEDPNEVLTFDGMVLKKNTKVESARDCDHLLNSLRFWGVNKMHDEIATFVLNCPSVKNDEVLSKYEEQFPYARALRMIKKTYGRNRNAKGLLCDAIKAGCVEVVEFLMKGKKVLPELEDASLLATRGGSVEMLAFVHQLGYALTQPAACEAAVHGHVDCLRYALSNGVALSSSMVWGAASGGQLACLQFLQQSGCRWDRKVSYYAAKSGHLDCL